MVKRWWGLDRVIVKVPWPFGTKVHRIDLSVKDLAVRWETNSVHLTVELERKIQYVTEAGTVLTRPDRVVYQKNLTLSPALIRGQPLQATATSLYLLVQDQNGAAYLEHGIGLRFAGWQHQPADPLIPSGENSLMILGKQLVAAENHLHTQTLFWPQLQPEDEPVEAVLTGDQLLLTPEGIHYRGELQLSTGKGERKKGSVSVLLPRKIPDAALLVGEAKLQTLKVVEAGKALLAVKLDWHLLQEKTLPVILAPAGQGEKFLLWRLWRQETRIWSGQTRVRLPEKAKIITEVTATAVESRIKKTGKGLLCLGRITLDLFYIDGVGQEKCYRAEIPWEEWVAAEDRAAKTAAPEEREYKIEVVTVKGEQIQFLNGEDVTLFVRLEYVLTEGQRQKAALPVPAPTAKTATILAERLITEEPFEYYVEIPVARPPDFDESHRLWWRDGEVHGETENGGVFLKVQPKVIWQYRNSAHQLKVVEFSPVIAWFHAAASIRSGDRAYVRTEMIRLQLQEKSGGKLGVKVMLNGWLTVTSEQLRVVSLGERPEEPEGPFLPAKKSSVLKWEEKLPSSVRQILSAYFFLGHFRQVKTEDLFLLEGEVRGEITYLGKDGVSRYYRLRKELWANLPPEYATVPVLLPVLTGWNCYPLPEWQWEKGGVWCEITLDLLAFAADQIEG